MKTLTGKIYSVSLIKYLLIVLCFCFSTAQAQTTAFNFQGRLNDGNTTANGHYDLQFKLFDALTGGGQIGSTVSKSNLTLINGVFSTQLDFGLMAFDGNDRFIEVGLRPTATGSNPPNAFVILGPRQQILSVPYTIRSLRSTLADDATHAVNADNATNATTAANSTSLGGVLATNYLLKNGDGSQLSNVNALTAATAVNSQQLGGVAADQFIQKGSIGTVKAMLYVDQIGNIQRCYNSTLSGSAATTIPCGFTVTEFTQGGFGISFGFNTTGTFVSVTTGLTDSVSGTHYPTYATFAYPYQLPQNINVFTWNDGGTVSTGAYFMITVY